MALDYSSAPAPGDDSDPKPDPNSKPDPDPGKKVDFSCHIPVELLEELTAEASRDKMKLEDYIAHVLQQFAKERESGKRFD